MRYGNSEFTYQDGRKETTAKRLSVTKVTGLLLACFVRNSLNTALFALLQKDLFKGMLSLVEGFSSNPIIVTLAHEVCRRLSSHVLLRKFTINVPTTGLLALETVGSFFQWLVHLNYKNNVYVVVNFRFSFVLNSLAYIIIPKNTGKIKSN